MPSATWRPIRRPAISRPKSSRSSPTPSIGIGTHRTRRPELRRTCRRRSRSAPSGASFARVEGAQTDPPEAQAEAEAEAVEPLEPPAPGRAGTGRRSRQRASRLGGAVLAAGLAVRGGDAGTLSSLGLPLDELRGLGPVAQCNRILNALVGSGADIDEAELRAASSTALIAVLTEDLPPSGAVRAFITEYVMEISLTELGATMREQGTGEVSVQIEDGLRSLITAQVDQLALDDTQVGPQQLQDALYGALGSARAVLRALA